MLYSNSVAFLCYNSHSGYVSSTINNPFQKYHRALQACILNCQSLQQTKRLKSDTGLVTGCSNLRTTMVSAIYYTQLTKQVSQSAPCMLHILIGNVSYAQMDDETFRFFMNLKANFMGSQTFYGRLTFIYFLDHHQHIN